LCSIIGVYGNIDASKLTSAGLFATQHRGQEATGISASLNKIITTKKKLGLVSEVFSHDGDFKTLKGNTAIGHNRYSTSGKGSVNDAQPIGASFELGDMSIVHNGNLINKDEVRKKLIKEGSIFISDMDTENVIHLIAKSNAKTMKDRIIEALNVIKGAYCFLIIHDDKMYAIRDKYGIRPMSIAKLKNGGYMVSSETCSFDLVEADFIRDVKAGEMVIFDDEHGMSSNMIFESDYRPCAFEYIYFARPDSSIDNKSVYEARMNMGRELAIENPIKADMVIPVPDSGVPSALGYAKESNISFELGLIRNHYVGRTFIDPDQDARASKVRKKLSPIKEIIKGKSIIIIDDSIVRGTTSKIIVSMLKRAGAKEIHFRVSSPPVKFPCYYGIDTPEKKDLIHANMSKDEVQAYLGCDSLEYLSIDGLTKSIGTNRNYAIESFNGDYFI